MSGPAISTNMASMPTTARRGLVTGNEDGVKHCSMSVLYALQHIGCAIAPQADAGWIGEAGPGPSYLDQGSGGPDNDFTNRNTTFMIDARVSGSMWSISLPEMGG